MKRYLSKKIKPYQCAVFKKKNYSLSIWGNVLALQTLHGNFLMFCQMVFISNNNFLISKQNKALKIDTKMLTGIAFLDMPSLLHRQTELHK